MSNNQVPTAGLRRNALGAASIVFFVIAAAAPLTAIVGAAPLAFSIGNGAGAPAAYLLAGLAYLIFASGFTAMSRYIGSAGAFYVFVSRGLGKSWGSATGAMTLLTYITIQIAVYSFFGIVAAGIGESAGLVLPWWVWTAICMIAVDIFATRSIELSGKVLGICMIGEVTVLMILNIAILAQGGGPEGINLASFNSQTVFSTGLGVSLLFAVASFIGFEATVIFSEEAKNPRRTIPTATYVAVLVITAFYAFSAWCMVVAYGSSSIREIATGDLSDLFTNTAADRVGEWLKLVMTALLVTSLFACVLSFQNTISRYLFALGRDGLLPKALGQTDTAYQAPRLACRSYTAFALVSICVAGIVGLDPYAILYSWLAASSALGVLIVQVLVCLSIIRFFRTNPHETTVWQNLLAPMIATISLGGFLILALTNLPLLTGDETWRVWLIPGAFVLVGLLGWGRSLQVKATDPAAYNQLAWSHLQD
ncbi:amino acid/polyamine/organocation transporter (APC superfamily) [Pseudaminobacter salicylatoxidans]|uniref:Amino acid/polyamine/organocation transporter (APC superfamily) n=1 Tax=Pseudaminobacter salicylatoxidans TaxID=93369 RepID=A0A316C4S6_PSESE|nr:APC family permease [Pseudaminobacter salicylatoxidans]PWJ84558.1 amino acid/polyamine/organocation transporter (APC superfamily) [Pseudaminobacter salicylatoxidans]